ncbi:MAG: TraR/DksA C4-type zinc finger protein [Bacteroidota bacterium]
MTKAERQQLKTKIEQQIEKLESEMIQLEANTAPISPENAIGRVSRMDAINNKGVAEAALANTKRKFSKLKMALGKVDEAGFGLCARCRQPIPAPRLMFMPESTRCVNCADR